MSIDVIRERDTHRLLVPDDNLRGEVRRPRLPGRIRLGIRRQRRPGRRRPHWGRFRQRWLGWHGGEPGAEPWGASEYVRWVQHALNQALGLKLPHDGVMDPETRSAIRRFQRRKGLAADGIVGRQTEQALIAATGITPGRLADAAELEAPGSPQPVVPHLIKRETTPPALSLYPEISLQVVDQQKAPLAPSMTGIFIPAGYVAEPTVDLILYLRGFTQQRHLAIDAYWNQERAPRFALRERLNQSRRNVVLVAPTLGQHSQAGRLTQPGGLDQYLNQVMAALSAYGPHRRLNIRPRVANIILACHSGGGLPMRKLALGQDNATQLIRECWGFDCTYNRGDDTLWAQWAHAHPGARLYIYYLAGTRTAPRALNLQRRKIPNILVERSPAPSHNSVPITHWRHRIEAAAYLRHLQPDNLLQRHGVSDKGAAKHSLH